MDDMDAKLWSKLPEDLVNRSISFLPVPVLCRFRTVCKGWDMHICKPTFQTLCMQNAKPDTCYLARLTFMERGQETFQDSHGWSFFETTEKRWYSIPRDQQAAINDFKDGPLCMVSDGGLLCELWGADCDDDNMQDVRSIVVSNPIAQTSTLLPSFPYPILPECARVNMVVDTVAQSYKVYVMLNHDNKCDDEDFPFMVVYDSKTDHWQKATKPPLPQVAERSICAHYSVVLNGLLYILMSGDQGDFETLRYWIWRYDLVEGTWSDTGVSFNKWPRDYVQLVVSDGRLFLGSWVRNHPLLEGTALNDQGLRWAYEICEVNHEEKTFDTVFVESRDAMVLVLDVPGRTLEHPRGGMGTRTGYPFGTTASGFRKTIILTPESHVYNKSGESMVFDLRTRLCERLLPINPLIPLPANHLLRFANLMSLALPESTSWTQLAD